MACRDVRPPSGCRLVLRLSRRGRRLLRAAPRQLRPPAPPLPAARPWPPLLLGRHRRGARRSDLPPRSPRLPVRRDLEDTARASRAALATARVGTTTGPSAAKCPGDTAVDASLHDGPSRVPSRRGRSPRQGSQRCEHREDKPSGRGWPSRLTYSSLWTEELGGAPGPERCGIDREIAREGIDEADEHHERQAHREGRCALEARRQS